MKNLLYILLFAPLSLFGQEQDPCYSINDFITQLDIKPPISYQLNVGWNIVGYTGTAENSGIVTQINGALSNDATAESTFQVIKNVSGQFWSSAFAQISNFTQGEGYMMYVISDSAPSLSFNSAVNIPEIIGCTDCTAENFNAWATSDDESCLILGCTSELAVNFDPEATVDDGLCEYEDQGCMNSLANNYNLYAEIDDGSCIYGNFNLNADIFEDNDFSHASTGQAIIPNVPSEFLGSLYIAHFGGENISPVQTVEVPEFQSTMDVMGIMGIVILGYDYLNGPDAPGAQPGQQVNIALLHPSGSIVDVIVSPPIIYEINLFSQIDEVVYSISGQEVIFGCTNPSASNYYPNANLDNESCMY